MGIVVIPLWIRPPWRWEVEVFLILREFEDRPLLSWPPSLFVFWKEPWFSFTWKFTATVPFTFSLLNTTKSTWINLNGPKPFPDDSSMARASHTGASCICTSSHATSATTTHTWGYQMSRDHSIQTAVFHFDFTVNPLEMGRNYFGLNHRATGNL